MDRAAANGAFLYLRERVAGEKPTAANNESMHFPAT